MHYTNGGKKQQAYTRYTLYFKYTLYFVKQQAHKQHALYFVNVEYMFPKLCILFGTVLYGLLIIHHVQYIAVVIVVLWYYTLVSSVQPCTVGAQVSVK